MLSCTNLDAEVTRAQVTLQVLCPLAPCVSAEFAITVHNNSTETKQPLEKHLYNNTLVHI